MAVFENPLYSTVTLGLLLVVLFDRLIRLANKRSSASTLPPGPKPLPFIGNALQIPTAHPEVTFAEWGRTYGGVVHISVFGKPTIIINSYRAAEDLLDKRSAIYSDRPHFVLLSDMMGWQNASTHVRYGPRFRKHRRFIHQTFNQRAAQGLRGIQYKEALVLLDGCIKQPQQFLHHIRRFAAASVLKVTYGADIRSIDDPLVQTAELAGMLTTESGTPAASLVDYFPWMRHIPAWAPFAGFKRDAKRVKAAVEEMMNGPFEAAKRHMRSGTAKPCLVTTLLEQHSNEVQEQRPFDDEEDIKGVCGTLFSAAQDTTVAVLTTFVLAMVRNPEAFRKAQSEIDRVVGPNRLPTMEDRSSLPYLECIIKEVYRWNPPVPLGLPHRLMEDDVYDGNYIPAGSTVLANIFAMAHNCLDPAVFRPERFMDKLEEQTFDPRDIVFGFGRRRCPGRYFADASVWFASVLMIATLDISRAKDQFGEEIVPPADFAGGFVRHPLPFSCSISPRIDSGARLATIVQGITV